MIALQRQRFDLSLNLSDLLLSILKNEQLFQFRMHGSGGYWLNRVASIAAQLVEGVEHLFGSRSDRDVVRQIDPANNAMSIN